jgi:Fe-S cluster assembly iron-binding protein IscA
MTGLGTLNSALAHGEENKSLRLFVNQIGCKKVVAPVSLKEFIPLCVEL